MNLHSPPIALFAKKLGRPPALFIALHLGIVSCATPPKWLGGPEQSPIIETNGSDDSTSAISTREDPIFFLPQKPRQPDLASIPLVITPEVAEWVRYFRSKSNRTFDRWAARGEPMRAKIQGILSAKGLPKELYYLAMVESGFIHGISSPKRARGPWQLIPATARLYGLRVDKKVDERIDPEKSTQSAAAYLRSLYLTFEDWHLALAAYNAGPKKILDLMKQTKATDYWTLAKSGKMRYETRDFVPKVLAAIIVGERKTDQNIEAEQEALRLSIWSPHREITHRDRGELLHRVDQKRYAVASLIRELGNKQSRRGSRRSG